MRSRNPIIQLLKQCLPPADPISNSVSDDKFAWKTRQHLYFDCQYSSAVWSYFMVKVNLQPPQSFDAILSWLDRPSSNSHLVLIIRFIYQASKYAIWKERNTRIHSSISRPP
ncbi:unnamed protein product, partial [Brassica oleracea]